jgi:hypothetical protein
MTEMRTAGDLCDAIIAERGGDAAFSVVQKRIAIALAHALATPSKVDPGTVTKMLDQLPPVTVVPQTLLQSVQEIDVAGLSDVELTVLTEIVARHVKSMPPLAPPTPGSLEAKLVDAEHQASFWRTEAESLHARLQSAENQLAIKERLHADEVRKLHDELASLRPASEPPVIEGTVTSPALPSPSNVIPHPRSNGGLEVTTSLRERYPMIDGLPR